MTGQTIQPGGARSTSGYARSVLNTGVTAENIAE
jgi:hypothetical protein